jgi:filamentous hemagglutinin family protein
MSAPKRDRWLCGAAIGLVLAAGGHASSARAQSFQGSAISPDVSASAIAVGTGTLITVLKPNAILDWTPSDTLSNRIVFQPVNTQALFASSLPDYTILNRIQPVDANNNPVFNRPIEFNGNIDSRVTNPATGLSSRGGSVWFYSPGGIILGAQSTIDVGSLVLSTSEINPNSIFTGTGGFVNFTGTPNPSSAIEINSRAQITATGGGANYVAMVAPRIVQNGTVTVDGSVAYVGAEVADISIATDGLFSIRVATGTGDANGIVHTGSTEGPESTGPADVQRIYLTTVPKNTALTMLVGGTIGYSPAVVATAAGGDVILSAGYDINNGTVTVADFAPRASATDANIAIGQDASRGPTLFTTNVLARASGSLTANPNGPALFIPGSLAFNGNATLVGDQSAVVQVDQRESLRVGGTLAIGSVFQGTGGTAILRTSFSPANPASGGAITIGGALFINASAVGRSGLSAGGFTDGNFQGAATIPLIGGNGLGGTAGVEINNGSLNVAGGTSVFSLGIGGYGLNAYGSGTGGAASINIFGPAARAQFGGLVQVSSSGLGFTSAVRLFGAAAQTAAAVNGGNGRGGSSRFIFDGQSLTLPAALFLFADGAGDPGGDSDLVGGRNAANGGFGFGGTTSLSLSSGVYAVPDVRTSAFGIGGAGGNSITPALLPGVGGNGNGGSATILLSGTTDLATSGAPNGLLGAAAFGLGGAAGQLGVGAIGPTGGAGSGTGGTALIALSGTARLTADRVVSTAAGLMGEPFSGQGGNAVGGSAQITIDGSASVATADMLIDASAANRNLISSGLSANSSAAGQARLTVNGGTLTAPTLTILADAIGGDNSAGAAGGNAIGGTASATFDGNTARLVTDTLVVNSAARGGSGGDSDFGGGAGGNGSGGTSRLTVQNGASASITNPLSLTATGNGGLGGGSINDGDGGRGGDGQGGIAEVIIARASLTLPDTNLDARARAGSGGNGGGRQSGTGGTGGAVGTATGGVARLVATSSIVATGNLDFNADAGNDETGGAGGQSLFDSGGAGGAGGIGAGGTAALASTGSAITSGSLTLSAQGFGLGGGGGGDGPAGTGANGAPGTGIGGLVTVRADRDALGVSGTLTTGAAILDASGTDFTAVNRLQTGRVEIINSNGGSAAGTIRFLSLTSTAGGAALGAAGRGIFTTMNEGDILVDGITTLNSGDQLQFAASGEGQFVSSGNLTARADTDIGVSHTAQPGLIDTIVAPVGDLRAGRNFTALVGSRVRGTDRLQIQATDGVATADTLSAASRIDLGAGGDVFLRNATVTNVGGGASLIGHGVINIVAGAREPFGVAQFVAGSATLTGVLTAPGRVDVNAATDIIVGPGAQILSNNVISLNSGDDVLIGTGAGVFASRAPISVGTPQLTIAPGAIATPGLSPTEVNAFVAGAGAIISAGGKALSINADAIDARGADFIASTVSATISNAPVPGVIGRDDGGNLSSGCVEGNICLGGIRAATQINIGPSTGTVGLANNVVLNGSQTGDIVSIRARDSIGFQTGTPISINGQTSLFIGALNGPINLTGPITLSAGGTLGLFAGGAINGPGTTLQSVGNTGLFAGGDISLGGIDAGGVLNTIDGNNAVTTAGRLVTAGSLSVTSNITLRGGAVDIQAGRDITIGGATSVAGLDVILNAGGTLTAGRLISGRDTVLTSTGNSLISHSESVRNFRASAARFETGLNSIITLGDINITTAGDTLLGNSQAGGSVFVNAGGLIDFNSLISGGTTTLGAGTTLTGVTASSGGAFTANAGTAVTLASTTSSDVVTITAGTGNITLGTAAATGDIGLFADAGSITANNANAGGDVIVRSGINAALTSASAAGTFVNGNGVASVGNIFVIAGQSASIGTATAATSIGVRGTSITGTGNWTAGEDVFSVADTTANLATVSAGDDIDITAPSGIVVANGIALGTARDDRRVLFTPAILGATFTPARFSLVAAPADGGDIRLTTTAGPITVASLDAADDVLISSGGVVAVTGLVQTRGVGATGGASNVVVNGASVALGSVAANTDAQITATGAINTGAITAGRDVQLAAGTGIATANIGTTTGSLTATSAASDIVVGAANIAGDIRLFADAGAVTASAANAAGDVLVRSGTNAALTTASAAGTFVSGGGVASIGNVFVIAGQTASMGAASAATSIGIRGASVSSTGAWAAIEDVFVQSDTTANLASISAGDDVDVIGPGGVTLAAGGARGSARDDRRVLFSPGSLGAVITPPNFSIIAAPADGGDIRLTATTGPISAVTLDAADDVLVSAGGAVTVAGLIQTRGLGATNGASSVVINGLSAALGSVNGNTNAQITATGAVTANGPIAAGTNVEVTGATLGLSAVTAGQNATLRATVGAISTGSVQANGGNVDIGAIAGGVTTGDLVAANDVVLTADGPVTVALVASGDDIRINTSVGGITAASLTTAPTGVDNEGDGRNALLRAPGDIATNRASISGGVLDLGAGQSASLANATVTGDIIVDAQAGAAALNSVVSTGGRIDTRSNGDTVLANLVSAATTLNSLAGGLLSLNGEAVAPTIALRSRDIAISPTARLGRIGTTQTATLTNNTGNLMTIGGAGVATGYSLSGTEITRVFADNIAINWADGPTRPVPSPNLILDSLTLTSRATDPQGNLGAQGTFSVDAPSIRVVGAALLKGAAAANTLRVTAPIRLDIISGLGSIGVQGASGDLAGVLSLDSAIIAAATPTALTDIAALTSTDDIDKRLGVSDGVAPDAVTLGAATINLKVANGLFIQNTASSSLFRNRRGFNAGSINVITTLPTAAIIINGQILGATGTVATGLAALPLISINGQASQLSTGLNPRSTGNGCLFAGVALCTAQLNPTSVTSSNATVPVNTARGPSAMFPTTLVELKEFVPLGYPPLIDEPVTGSGNDDLWLEPCDPSTTNCSTLTGPN